jgi:hypothetical protein
MQSGRAQTEAGSLTAPALGLGLGLGLGFGFGLGFELGLGLGLGLWWEGTTPSKISKHWLCLATSAQREVRNIIEAEIRIQPTGVIGGALVLRSHANWKRAPPAMHCTKKC